MKTSRIIFGAKIWVTAIWVAKVIWLIAHIWFVRLDWFVFVLALMCSFGDPVIFQYFGDAEVQYYDKKITEKQCIIWCVGLGVVDLLIMGFLFSVRVRFIRS